MEYEQIIVDGVTFKVYYPLVVADKTENDFISIPLAMLQERARIKRAEQHSQEDKPCTHTPNS